MSALLRPHGDELANIYGVYYTAKKIKTLKGACVLAHLLTCRVKQKT
jgi:hypothetical protein